MKLVEGSDGVYREQKGYYELWLQMSYTSWLTMPRALMHEMPDEWQGRMAELIKEWDEYWDFRELDLETFVSLRKDGRFSKAPEYLVNYRHPMTDEIEKLKHHNDC